MARGLILLSLLLATISLWAAAAPFVERVFGHATAMASSPGGGAPAEAAVDIGPVLDFAPFGNAEGSQDVAQPDSADIGLVLLGITVARTPGRSRAIIAGGQAPSALYGIGETVRTDVRVTGIFADHVTLTWGGQDQALYFEPTNAGTVPQPAVLAGPAIEAATSSDSMIGRYRAEIMQDAPGLIERLGLKVTEGGYLVTEAAAAEVLQAGLLPGDLVTGVNGNALGDLDSDPALFDEAADVGQANLSVLRGGATFLMTFPLK